MILVYALSYDLIIATTYFRKSDEHLKIDRIKCKDCKVILGESLTTQHKLVVLDLSIKK